MGDVLVMKKSGLRKRLLIVVQIFVQNPDFRAINCVQFSAFFGFRLISLVMNTVNDRNPKSGKRQNWDKASVRFSDIFWGDF